jgi:hypothetical protein
VRDIAPENAAIIRPHKKCFNTESVAIVHAEKRAEMMCHWIIPKIIGQLFNGNTIV